MVLFVTLILSLFLASSLRSFPIFITDLLCSSLSILLWFFLLVTASQLFFGYMLVSSSPAWISFLEPCVRFCDVTCYMCTILILICTYSRFIQFIR
jgi:hypothetical protein